MCNFVNKAVDPDLDPVPPDSANAITCTTFDKKIYIDLQKRI